MFFQIFSPSLWLIFSFKCSYLSAYGRADVLGLMKSNLAIFLFWIVLLVLYLKSHHQTQGHLDLLCFIVLRFTFRSLIHFDVTSESCKVCIFFHVDVPLFQHQPCAEKSVLSSFDCLSPLSKISRLSLCESVSGLSVCSIDVFVCSFTNTILS